MKVFNEYLMRYRESIINYHIHGNEQWFRQIKHNQYKLLKLFEEVYKENENYRQFVNELKDDAIIRIYAESELSPHFILDGIKMLEGELNG